MKITHLLFVDDLKLYAKSEIKISVVTKKVKEMYEDIGTSRGLEKCASLHVVRGKESKSEDLPIGAKYSISVMESSDKYKFLGKYENFEYLDKFTFQQAEKEYLRRLNVIWSSPLSVPSKQTACIVFALPTLEYFMGTSNWLIADIQNLDRKSRKVVEMHKGKHILESIAMLYLPQKCGGRGFRSVEDTYKISKIKVAHHINISKDPRIKLVRSFQHYKSKKNFKSTFVEATRYAKEHFKADLSLLEEKSVLSYEQERLELKDENYIQIQRRLGSILQRLYEERVRNQPWLGFYTVSTLDSDEISKNSGNIFRSWKNIPDIVLSTNESIKQQLLPTKAYSKYKLKMETENTTCSLCKQAEETVVHLLCSCAALAQTLYKARHDRMLRPIYHLIRAKFEFDGNNRGVPWYKQALPLASIENDRAKIMWDIPMHLDKRPSTNAIKPDMLIIDKVGKKVSLIEGTICAPGCIAKREKEKQDKYSEMRKSLERLNRGYEIDQINVVFDFLGCYSKQLECHIKRLCEGEKEAKLVIEQCQKWVLSQNCEIVKTFYERE